jgi:maspardin
VLKNLIMGGLENNSNDNTILNATSFMAERLDSLSQTTLASRLAINCATCQVQPNNISDLPMTIINVWDQSALSDQVSNVNHRNGYISMYR